MRTFLFFKVLLFIFSSVVAQNNTTFTTETAKEITNFIESKRKYYNSPSIAVAITDENNTVYLNHFGNAKKDDKYLIGSMSKSFTALLVLKLQEQGKLRLEDPVSKYLKWFAYKNKTISDKITIENLLRHTSGISTEMGRTFKTDNNFDYVNYYTELLRKIELKNSTRIPFKYSNVNYRLLGLIIENVTGKTYDKCLEELIAKPMELTKTSGEINTDIIDSYQYLLYYPILKFNEKLHEKEVSSGLISSAASDMAIYLRNIMNSYNNNPNTVLKPSITKQLMTKEENSNSFYGLGWFVNNDASVLYHGGTNKSFESQMYIIPKLKKAIVVLINSNQAPDVEIINGIYEILLGKGYYNKSSFPYYRNLPLIFLVVLLIFLFQFRRWKKLNYAKHISKKVIPNLFFIIGVIFSITILILIPKLNGVSLKTTLQFDPSSGYSLILISLFLLLTFLLNYLSAAAKTQNN